MDPQTIVAICSAGVAVAAAFVSGVQARFARQQVEVGRRQADQADLAFRTQQKELASVAVQDFSAALDTIWMYLNRTVSGQLTELTSADMNEKRRMKKLLQSTFEGTAIRQASISPTVWRLLVQGYSTAIMSLQSVNDSEQERRTKQRELLDQRVALKNSASDWWGEPA